ncbi:response regulator [Ferirhizobium litorale]|nr:response regulator [Fererhizobium litorale]
MAAAQDDLLTMACRRIIDLDTPACVKNSELRYVAVNRAYADFFGIEMEAFAGLRSSDLISGEEIETREDVERRAIVFGTEESVTFLDPATNARHSMLVERFQPDDDSIFLFSMFHQAPPATAGDQAIRRENNPMPYAMPLNPFVEAMTTIIEAGAVQQPIDQIRGARVLAVSDDACNCETLADLLSKWALDGHAAENGAMGFAVIEAAHGYGGPVECLLVDSDPDGDELIRRVRSDARFANLPVILLGGETSSPFPLVTSIPSPVRDDTIRAALVDAIQSKRRCDPPAPQERAGLDVLVAEDNRVHQIVFERILSMTGLSYLIVGNGRAAVEAWETHRPSMVVMDVLLPAISGFQAAREIRQRERKSADPARVPIVGVTSYSPEIDRSLCLDAGMDDQIVKPLSPEPLVAKISEWLRRDIAIASAG